MITRPLDLASKLRPEPRNFDVLFFVNGCLLVFFFYFFGSRFVLAPSLGVDFRLAQLPGVGVAQTTHHISVKRDGMIFADNGQITLAQLRIWLDAQKKVTKEPVLLVLLDSDVPTSVSTDIYAVARDAGFQVVQGVDAAPAKPGVGR